MIKLHAVSYMSNGLKYGMTLEGSHEEINAHAMRLGLSVDGEIVEQIEISDDEMQSIVGQLHDLTNHP